MTAVEAPQIRVRRITERALARRGRDLKGAVVVILGASSGVGRAAALAFAKEGAHLVLAARRGALLEEVAEACRALGSEALPVVTDAADADAVRALAEAAVGRFTRIDVWINNVGIGAVGAFDETPIAAHDQIVRVNLLGYLHGAHAVLPYFRRQGSGVLINTNSIGGWVPAPYGVAYAASKFGLRGYSESLRAELGREKDIHVCDVFPTFLDTPGVAHGANYVGRKLRPAPLVEDPEAVAQAMVKLAKRPRGAVTVGAMASAARVAHAVAPGPTAWSTARLMELYFRFAGPAERSDGILFQPGSDGQAVHGGWRRPELRQAVLGAALGVAAGTVLMSLFDRIPPRRR